MYSKNLFLVIFVFLCFSVQAQIQQKSFSSDKEKIKLKNTRDFADRKQYNSLMFDYSFQYTHLPDNDFLNSNHFQTSNFVYGNAYTFRVLIYPVLVDAATFASYFDTYSNKLGTDRLIHRGGEFTASYILPTYNILPKRLYPYIGVGYQSSTMAFDEDRFPSQSILYKAGILFNWRQDVYLNLEYSQSSIYKNKYPYQHFTFSLGIRGKTLSKTLALIGEGLFYALIEAW